VRVVLPLLKRDVADLGGRDVELIRGSRPLTGSAGVIHFPRLPADSVRRSPHVGVSELRLCTRIPSAYFFGFGTAFAAAALFFFCVAASFALPCFCLDCFWFAFGDLSPIRVG
jgi:hypothetical protein